MYVWLVGPMTWQKRRTKMRRQLHADKSAHHPWSVC